MGPFLSDVMYKAGLVLSTVFWFLEQHAAAITVLLAIAGFAGNMWYKHRDDKRKQALADERMRSARTSRLRAGTEEDPFDE